MILALVPIAVATLPWMCPSFSTPEEAYVYRTDGGLPTLFDALETEARTWWDEDCAWTSTALSDGSTEESCTTDAGASIVYTSYAVDGNLNEPTVYEWIEDWTLDVGLPEGADDWTAISLSSAYHRSSGSSSGGHSTTLVASWIGTVAGAPDDGSFTYEEVETSSTRTGSWDTYDVTTPDCAWRWGESWNEDGWSWVDAPDHDVDVWSLAYTCAGNRDYAEVDGTLFGAVVRATWALDEVDRDGWSVAAGDCDDADPTVYPCATEEAVGDGWDQDCDGTDDTDEDGDGYVTDAANGDDCDDRASGTHPGAPDPAGDEVDQNCDGADEVDADGDGFTVDGDDGDADCDDTTWTIRPGANDRACDGVDQDCDGADTCDTGTDDTGGDTASGDADTAEADTAAPADDADEGPKDEEGGCGAGGSALLLVPWIVPALLRRGRRRG